MADFNITYHGMFAAIEPLNEAAKAWLGENVASEDWQRHGDRLIVEPSYLPHLMERLVADGLTFEE